MIKGKRLKPRVGIVGNFSEIELERFNQIFPTVWYADSYRNLTSQISYNELDLLIVGDNYRVLPDWYKNLHVITFSRELPNGFLGPNDSWIRNDELSLTEEFELPQLPLQFDRLRKADLSNVNNLKGQQLIRIEFNSNSAIKKNKESLKIFKNNTLFFVNKTYKADSALNGLMNINV